MRITIKIHGGTLLIAIILFGFSCNKNKDIKKAPIQEKWVWVFTRLNGPISPTNPQTPQNTGNQELLIFNINYTWEKFVNNSKVDSGTYSLGHGIREEQPYYRYEYDSVKYYQNGMPLTLPDYYYCGNDSLIFNPGLNGSFSSYTLPFGGVKCWIKL